MSIGRVKEVCLFLSLIVLPINDLPIKGLFGELAVEASFYFFMIAIMIWISEIISNNQMRIISPKSQQALIFFFLWILVSFFANSISIAEAEIKGRLGIEKFIFQFLVLLFCICISWMIAQYIYKRKDAIIYLRKAILISMILCSVYSLIEIAAFMSLPFAQELLIGVNSAFRAEDKLTSGFGRLRSLSGEPAMFAMYVTFALPWISSFLFTENRRWPYLFLLFYISIMMVLTFSRAAYIVFLVESLLILFFLRQYIKNIFGKYFIVFGVFILLMGSIISYYSVEGVTEGRNLLAVIYSFTNDDSQYNLSNIARFGSQVAGINMFLENFVFGVGFGQYGFYMKDFIPSWALISKEILDAISTSEHSPWAIAHGLYSRLLAELGLLGLLIWVYIWVSLLRLNLRNSKLRNISPKERVILKMVSVSLVSSLLIGFVADSFRFFGYWIIMGVVWGYSSVKE